MSLRRIVFPQALAIAIVVSIVAPAHAGPMPPQLPSPEEMAQLNAQMEVTLSRVRAAQAQLNSVVAKYEEANDRLTALAGQVTQTQLRQDALDAEMRAAQATINTRAASTYRVQRIGLVDALLKARTFRQFITMFGMFKSVTKHDSMSVDHVRDLRAEAIKVRTELESQKAQQQRIIGELASQQRQMKVSLNAVGREFDAVRAEVEKRKSGFAFPVKAPYSYSNSWGAPRMEGTKYYHRHEGTDIFALAGTPVVAVVDGRVENMGTAVLGGIKLWLRSPGDNWTYYYAHLTGFAAGLTNGTMVKKGQILGYVGNTGNARGTPPHLHFETHIPSGAPVDPYPILRRVDPLAK